MANPQGTHGAASSSGTETKKDQETLPPLPDPNLLLSKSTFIPPKRRNSSVDTYCRLVERDMSDLQRQKRDTELETFKNYNSIVIQSAHKGGALVILDRDA